MSRHDQPMLSVPLERAGIFNRWVGVGALLLSLAFCFWVTPEKMAFFPCFFKSWTGLNCPACGLTRSLYAVRQFRLDLAFHYHIFGPLLFFGAFGLMGYWLGELLCGKKLCLLISRDWGRRMFVFLLVVWLGYWLLRIHPSAI